jgi:energy-coupling factor transporter transmembrane protein EcfT
MRESVTFDIKFDYWTAYKAELRLFLRSPGQIAVSSVFPLAGLFILYTIVVHHAKLPASEIALELLIVLLCVLFTPLTLAFTLFMNRRENTLNRGFFTYRIDPSGIRVASNAVESTVKWPAIRRVVESKNFVFLYIAPGRAISLPMEQLQSAGVLEDVRGLIQRHFAGTSA